MATPHIAGLIAYLISANGGDKIPPADMIKMIRDLGQRDVLVGVRKSRRGQVKMGHPQANHICSTSNDELLGAKSLVVTG